MPKQLKKTLRRTYYALLRRIGTIDMRYSSARFLEQLKMRLAPQRDLLLIFTISKVGSTSIHRSLDAEKINRRIYHLHSLVPEQLQLSDKLHRDLARKHRGTTRERGFFPRHIWRGQYLSNHLRNASHNGQSCKVITLVRDPVARSVSSFFQTLKIHYDIDSINGSESRALDDAVSELNTLFLEKVLPATGADRLDTDPTSWFDEQLKVVFDVDVFATPFPKEDGYCFYESPKASVLLLRTEDLDKCASPAVKKHLNLSAFEITRANVGEDKEYAALYRKFLDQLEIPANHLDQMYGSKTALHFYSAQELAKFRDRWDRGTNHRPTRDRKL